MSSFLKCIWLRTKYLSIYLYTHIYKYVYISLHTLDIYRYIYTYISKVFRYIHTHIYIHLCIFYTYLIERDIYMRYKRDIYKIIIKVDSFHSVSAYLIVQVPMSHSFIITSLSLSFWDRNHRSAIGHFFDRILSIYIRKLCT